jgi:hypothetical protein
MVKGQMNSLGFPNSIFEGSTFMTYLPRTQSPNLITKEITFINLGGE